MASGVQLTRGSHLSWPLRLRDKVTQAPIDLTGQTIEIVEVIPPALAATVVAVVTDDGGALLTCPWSHWPPATAPFGAGAKVSIRLKPSGSDEAWPAILVILI